MTNQNEDTGPLSVREPTAPQGPRRRAPHYYVGETCGTKRGKGSYGRGTGTMRRTRSVAQVRHTRYVNYPDVQRYPNGALPGIRNKLARRRIRGALMRANSTIEARVRRARQLRLSIPSYNSHEARRLFEKTLSLHMPTPSYDSRALRTAFRKAKRAAAKEKGIHVRDLDNEIVKGLADKIYGGADAGTGGE